MQAALMLCPFIKADGSRFHERVRVVAEHGGIPPLTWTLVHDVDRGIRYLAFSAFDERVCATTRRKQVDYFRLDFAFPSDFIGPLEGDYITSHFDGARIVSFYCENGVTAERLRARFR